MPERIQRRRTKGWRMPEGAVYVGRPTKWGNPFRAHQDKSGIWRVIDNNGVDYPLESNTRRTALIKAVSLYSSELHYWSDLHQSLAELRGLDLVCWCPVVDTFGQPFPCHADVLLFAANRTRTADE